jgi:hypothetical protein
MKIVLEINNEGDWAALLPLLERLQIPFTNLSGKTAGQAGKNGEAVKSDAAKAEEKSKKNYDIEKLERLFNELHSINAFANITDPVAWQKQIRDEWE